MPDSAFRFVCLPSALLDTPRSWAREMLREGEIALLPDHGGWDDMNRVAHQLGLMSIAVLRVEESPERQADTVIAYADALPLVWIGDGFSARVTQWARNRGPMTLLVDAEHSLAEDERRRIERFLATLGRQSE